MASSIGATVGRHGIRQRLLLFEQRTKIERAVRIAAPIGATVGILSGGLLVLAFEQHPEIAGRSGVFAFVGPTIGRLGDREVTPFLEPHPEIEGSDGITEPIFAGEGRHLVRQVAVVRSVPRCDGTIAGPVPWMGAVSSRHATLRVDRLGELPVRVTAASRRRDSRGTARQPPQ